MNKKRYSKRRYSKKFDWKSILILVVVLLIAAVQNYLSSDTDIPAETVKLDNIPAYSGEPYVVISNNVPTFGDPDSSMRAYEEYGELDSLGRCTTTIACIDQSLMPTEDRGDISSVKPTGWVNNQYDFVDGKSLYNRCHLIGFQLTGENANDKNLITGTRYMNVEGMLPFENMVADYIKETGNRVLYRVTPIFQGSELVARGVQMEAYSIDDNGEGVCFNVFCYNVQPGVEINYATGENWEAAFSCDHDPQALVLNTSSGKFHTPDCSGAQDMNPDNRENVTCCPEELIAKGYEACGVCKPAA